MRQYKVEIKIEADLSKKEQAKIIALARKLCIPTYDPEFRHVLRKKELVADEQDAVLGLCEANPLLEKNGLCIMSTEISEITNEAKQSGS